MYILHHLHCTMPLLYPCWIQYVKLVKEVGKFKEYSNFDSKDDNKKSGKC
jgi:hypothetical protein